ncbi:MULTISPECIES: hypothetical protein [Nonomuraea]|uniref:Uncharacterized protein n=1 Tax=Nonomuraea mangrovi TaxID=2316207 RepID=A0ABW4T858_9ACTN
MAFLSRLFKRGSGDPLSERDHEREEAHQQGVKDAREQPLRHFTDAECQPAFLFEIRSRARERIARVDQGVAARRTDLLREVGLARETVFRETGRADLHPGVTPNGGAAESGRAAGRGSEGGRHDPHGDHPGTGRARPGEEDPFISIAEARRRRAERARREALREASDRIHGARSRIEQLAREWDGMLVERNHEVEAIHAWAQQVIAAYRRGVMGAHPRREEIPSLWKGEVVAMDSVGDGVTAISSREEIGGLLEEVEHRIEIWHSEVRGVGELPRGRRWRELPAGTSADLPREERRRADGSPHEDDVPRDEGSREDGGSQDERPQEGGSVHEGGSPDEDRSPDEDGRAHEEGRGSRDGSTGRTGDANSVGEARGER